MVSPSRSSASRRRRDDAGKFFTGLLLLLGLVASIFLVFSENVHMVRIGLVAALWAAAIGALAATRFRRESAIDKAKVGDLQKVYTLQLEREVAARREYEHSVEARVRGEVGADAEEMAALRTELTVLRESLQRLFDGDLLFERPALHAEAVRVQELPRRASTADSDAANDNWDDAEPWDPWSAPDDSDARSRITPVFEPDHPEPPAFATPFDDPVTAETSVVTESMRLDYERAEALKAEGLRKTAEPTRPTPKPDRESTPASASAGATAPGAATDPADTSTSAGTPASDSVPAPASASASASASSHPANSSDALSSTESKSTRRTEPIPVNRDNLQEVPWFETDLSPAGNASLTNLGAASNDAGEPKQTTGNSTGAPAARNGAPESTGKSNPPVPRLAPQPEPAAPIGTASARRRRRADEDNPTTGPRLSVAEIMANLRSEKSEP
ncbi:DUF6779 domain-containing protein [Nocardia jejuensis]|uniref:DUF6779 domain-containing protein n=1 Tax=Nocardia jejuensis TaxID=328049 RepID=UPI000833FCCD|nr:DUF6779 domain-containing protein [Nocardia jejuensis]